MPEHTYSVYVEDKRYARDMDLTTALMLVETLFTKWYKIQNLYKSIKYHYKSNWDIFYL